MTDSSNPYDPQRSTFPWKDAEPVVPLMPPPAVPQPSAQEPAPQVQAPAAQPPRYAAPAQMPAPAPYNPQPRGPYGYPQAQPAQQSKGLAITGLVLSLVGMLTSFIFIGFPITVAALIIGIVGLSKRYEGKGMFVAAIIVASLTLAFSALMLVLIVISALASSTGV